MLYEYEKVKDNRWIIEEKPYYDKEECKRCIEWRHLYPHALYFDSSYDIEHGEKFFEFVKFRRFCDRKLKGDVIFSVIDRSYTYNWYSDPEKHWDYSHCSEQWIFYAFNFELLCDYYLVKKTFNYWCDLVPKHTRKPHHDWMKNPHIDSKDHDKYWDPRWKMFKKLESA